MFLLDWNGSSTDDEAAFDGNKLTRWHLKTVIGWCDAKKIQLGVDTGRLVEWLFVEDASPPQIGLAVPHQVVRFPQEAVVDGGCPPWVLSVLTDEDGLVFGLRSWFYPVEFTLDLRGGGYPSAEVRYRPSELYHETESQNRWLRVSLAWGEVSGGRVKYRLD
ncbi:MAG: hypothetical protein AAFU77_11870 [Myxococcota bacterium]